MRSQSHAAKRACAYKPNLRESVNYLQEQIDQEIRGLEELARQLSKDVQNTIQIRRKAS